MSRSQPGRASFLVATREHEAAMRRLLRENSMGGSIQLTLEREPDYFRGADLAGGRDRTILVFENDRLVCMGRSTVRDCWMNGQVRRVGYLAELRLDAAAQGRYDLIRRGYRYFQELDREEQADAYFTSIAAENHRARRLLESGRGLPSYRFLGEYTTLVIAVPRRVAQPRLVLEKGSAARWEEISEVLNRHSGRHQLSIPWTPERLRGLGAQGLTADQFYLARTGGRITACGAIWDQREFRQTVIRGYSAPLRRLRPLINGVAAWLGTPRLPAVGSGLSHAFLSPLAVEDEAMLPALVESLLPLARARRLEYLTLGLPSEAAALSALGQRFRARRYISRLYGVSWAGRSFEEFTSEAGPFFPEIGLL